MTLIPQFEILTLYAKGKKGIQIKEKPDLVNKY